MRIRDNKGSLCVFSRRWFIPLKGEECLYTRNIGVHFNYNKEVAKRLNIIK